MSAPCRDSRKRRRGGRECEPAEHAGRCRRRTLGMAHGAGPHSAACPMLLFQKAASHLPALTLTTACAAVPWMKCPQKREPRGATAMPPRQRASFGCTQSSIVLRPPCNPPARRSPYGRSGSRLQTGQEGPPRIQQGGLSAANQTALNSLPSCDPPVRPNLWVPEAATVGAAMIPSPHYSREMRDQSQTVDIAHNYANGLFDEVFCNEISGPGVWWPRPISGGPMNYSG